MANAVESLSEITPLHDKVTVTLYHNMLSNFCCTQLFSTLVQSTPIEYNGFRNYPYDTVCANIL